MREQSQNQPPQFNYITMMVPVPVPNPSDNKDEKKSEVSVIGGFFWAIIILLSVWFITGGYTVLR
jgi:hypothetical protein